MATDLLALRPADGFSVILADPPWSFSTYSAKGHGKSPQSHYACQGLDWIKALPVESIAAKDCLLWLWATAPMLPQAIEVMAAWGFTYKTAGPWAKQSKTGEKWAFGTGYIFRSAAEFFLVGTRGRPRVASRSVRNLIVAPVREHSRKPADAHQMLNDLIPDGPRLEMFAREAVPGWTAWGNQTTKFQGETP